MDALILADDLTGACDAAVQFRMRGVTTVVTVTPEFLLPSSWDVFAVNCETRDLVARERERRIRKVARNLASHSPKLVFKKIDSMMRGNPGFEILAAMDAFDCDIALITPAFPEMGRFVRDGYLQVDSQSSWLPIEVAGHLRMQGLDTCLHVSAADLSSAIEGGERYISVDTTCREDLDAVVMTALPSNRRILWAGSAGLASAVASAIFSASPRLRAPPPRTGLPVLFCIGSDHPVTAAQVSALARHYSLQVFEAAQTSAGQIIETLGQGKHVIVALDCREISSEQIQRLFQEVKLRVSALALSGGTTAALVCGALQAAAIDLQDEIITGLPWGFLMGGCWDRIPVATKSGAFGGSRALIQLADSFICPNQ